MPATRHFKQGERLWHGTHGAGHVETVHPNGAVGVRFDGGSTHRYDVTSQFKLHAHRQSSCTELGFSTKKLGGALDRGGFKQDERIWHTKHGEGTVEAVDERGTVRVHFDKGTNHAYQVHSQWKLMRTKGPQRTAADGEGGLQLEVQHQVLALLQERRQQRAEQQKQLESLQRALAREKEVLAGRQSELAADQAVLKHAVREVADLQDHDHFATSALANAPQELRRAVSAAVDAAVARLVADTRSIVDEAPTGEEDPHSRLVATVHYRKLRARASFRVHGGYTLQACRRAPCLRTPLLPR